MRNDSVYVHPKVRRVIELYRDLMEGDFYSLPIVKQLELQAHRLAEAHHDRDDTVCFQITCWHPELVGASDERILGHAFGMPDAKITIAREYGFADWIEVESIRVRRSDVDFEHAVNAMLAGDLASLKERVSKKPDLSNARSQYGHGATLLHYAGTNGVETYRQVVPLNLAEIVDFLLASGADGDSEANIYGGSTFLALFESSAHPGEANVRRAVLDVFAKHRSARD